MAKNKFPLYVVQINLNPVGYEPNWVNLEEILENSALKTEQRLCAYLNSNQALERAKETEHESRVIFVDLAQADTKTISAASRVLKPRKS